MLARLKNIFWLGIKELRSLQRDIILVVFVVYSFSAAIYVQATGIASEVNNASLAIVDEDRSALSGRIAEGFFPPRFQRPELIEAREVDRAMDRGRYMFVLMIPPKLRGAYPRRPAARTATQYRRDRDDAGQHRRQLHLEYRQ